jgi:hypothetical protein
LPAAGCPWQLFPCTIFILGCLEAIRAYIEAIRAIRAKLPYCDLLLLLLCNNERTCSVLCTILLLVNRVYVAMANSCKAVTAEALVRAAVCFSLAITPAFAS